MTAYRTLRWTPIVLAMAATLGCGRKPDAEARVFAPGVTPYAAQPNSGNAFDDYVLAAGSAEAKGGPNLIRVNFYPGHKTAAEKEIDEAVREVASGTQKPCSFHFVPIRPVDHRPYVLGWRLIGRVYAWEVADAVKAGNFDAAIDRALTGTRFGFDLTGGDALDASLGLTIVDDVRRALLPALQGMTSDQLNRLAGGMAEALARRVDPSATLANEKLSMYEGIQEVQDRFHSHQLAKLQDELGPNSKDGIDYLASLEGHDQKVTDYFNSLGAEANKVIGWGLTASQQATKDRTKLDLGKNRAWWRISRNYFGTVEPLLQIEDVTLARTRLLSLQASLSAMAKKKLPPSLSGLDPKLCTDPYSGKPFILHTDGSEFTIYSIGPNLKDDGGDSDASGMNPDLVLEQNP